MNYVRIKNLRSLKDTHEIEMKKINLLVGSNSSGKSTFLRVFPLLKQSFRKRINGPILWGGDDDYVDFGSFGEALNVHAREKSDTIRFVFDFFADYKFSVDIRSKGTVFQRKMFGNVKAEFAIRNDKKTTYDYVSELILEYEDYILNVSFSDKNRITMLNLNGDSIDIIEKADDFYDTPDGAGVFGISLFGISNTARKKLKKLLELEDDYKLDYDIELLYDALENKKYTFIFDENKIYEKVEYDKNHNTQKVIEFKKWVYLYYLKSFFNYISSYIIAYFKNVSYIAPIRATAEMYYRLQNLAVDEVDCRGKNLPIFLHSLREREFRSFQNWTLKNLGFKVHVFVSEGHVSLKIQKDGQEKAVNLLDTGFGYSQILPIVTQLWYIAEGVWYKRMLRYPYRNIPKTIVIEQPELHLHPALQAKLIDIIVNIATERNIHFIIETHSETMVNRIGSLIDRKKIKNDDVGIILFNKEFGEDETYILKSSFDHEGYLENWPIGFFEPED